MSFSQQVSALISRVKGSDYVVDPGISADYLLGTLLERAVMRARGVVRFRSPAAPFFGRGASVRGAERFSYGSGCTMGIDSYIDAMSRNGVRWGDNVSMGRSSRIECVGSLKYLGEGMTVGNNVGLGSDTFYGCAGGITIGDDSMIGNYSSMHSENHVTDDISVPIREQGVTHKGIEIGADCWIGARVTVLDGVRLGDGCIVAAGSVLTSGTYEDHGIYGGVPARLLKKRDGAPASAASTH